MSILSSLVHAISIFQSCCTARLVREKMNLPKEHGIRVRGGLVLLDKKHNNFRVGLNRVGLSRPKNQHLHLPQSIAMDRRRVPLLTLQYAIHAKKLSPHRCDLYDFCTRTFQQVALGPLQVISGHLLSPGNTCEVGSKYRLYLACGEFLLKHRVVSISTASEKVLCATAKMPKITTNSINTMMLCQPMTSEDR